MYCFKVYQKQTLSNKKKTIHYAENFSLHAKFDLPFSVKQHEAKVYTYTAALYRIAERNANGAHSRHDHNNLSSVTRTRCDN